MDILACPMCKGELELAAEKEDTDAGEVMEGSLKCGACGGVYRISGGIPDLRPVPEG